MPTPHTHVAKLVCRLGGEDYIVHKYKHVPNLALLTELLLLLEEHVDQRLVPLVEKETLVPFWVPFHHCFQNRTARGRTHKANNQVVVIIQSVH